MNNLLYFSLWIGGALIAVASLSALIAKNLHLREVRRAEALDLLDTLARYSDWVAGQRRTTFFQGDAQEGVSPLEKARTITHGWFPELSVDLVDLLIVHNRIIDFLWQQQVFRLKDPESWLVSDHDTRFLELWRHHRYSLDAIEARLQPLTGREALGLLDGTIPA